MLPEHSCIRCGSKHTKNEPCRCPECQSEEIIVSGGFSGDIRQGGGMVGIDIEQLECKECGFRWWW
jgi:hypothetical protein